MFQVITEFQDMNAAIKATELMSVAFPMLTFQLMEVPELDFDSVYKSDWENFINTEVKKCPTVEPRSKLI